MSPPSDESSTEADEVVDPSFLSSAGIGAARLAPTGEIVSTTGRFATLTGRPRDSLVGTPFASLLATRPSSLEAMLDGDAADGEALSLTLSVATDADDVVACESLLRAVPGDGDADSSIVVLLSRRREGGLDGSREFAPTPDDETAPAKAFVALADSLSDGIIVLDAESRIQYANPAVERILGYAPDELVGGSKLSIIPERLRQVHLDALNRYLETGQRNIDWEYVELPGQHKDGHEIPLGISLNDFFFDGDRYFVGLFRDITPRKRAEQALRDREQRLQRYKEYTDDVLDAIDDVFYVLDAEGDLLRWNQSVREVTGYDDEEIEAMHVLEFFDEDDRARVVDAISDGFETGYARVEADIVTSGGERLPYEFVASSLETPDGDTVLSGIGRDITEQREQRRKLEASNERLEQFAYAASHDLQEPLRMIISYLGLIEDRYAAELDDDGEEFIDFAVDGAERMREMIDGLLQYSRVDTRGEPMGPVDLNAVLEDVRNDLQLKIEESDATIRAGELPTVRGDGGQLRQVFQNLLANAIEYSGDEPPDVDIEAERRGEMWRIAVRDEGIGIDPDETDRVFRVFQRLHTRAESSGTGLGLALCRRIVERHGGRIWVESAPGDGSTFSFTLPDVPDRGS